MSPQTTAFLLAIVSIVLIDILLAGDNAVVIAMAVRTLSPQQRRIGTAVGAGGAVILRILLTFIAAPMLEWRFLKLVGGLLIFWIAIQLVVEDEESEAASHTAAGLRQAIWMILVADVTMSLDNILAVAAVSKGDLVLLTIGLALSITFVVFTSTLLSRLMNQYPWIIWIGAAILGRVGGGMIVTDPWVRSFMPVTEPFEYAAEAIGAAVVVVLGYILKRRKHAHA
jgi:YjbE family integral membrane protein